MKSLRELQETFQRGILAGDDSILAEVKDSAKELRKVLFGVYRNAYVARIAEILADDYAQLHAYLRSFMLISAIKPSPSWSKPISTPIRRTNAARWFGRHLPDFVRESGNYVKHPEVAEIADLEKALADAFDGPDAAPLTIDALAPLATKAWPQLTLKPHPTAIRLTFRTNAAEIWSALKEEAAPLKPRQLPEPQAIVVWRQEFMARFKPLTAEEAMMWNEAAKGVAFGVLCEMVATFASEDEAELRAATYLKGWVDMGMLAGFQTH